MAHNSSYVDLEMRILERQAQGYPIEITFDREQEFPRGFLAPDFLPWIPSDSPSEDGERLFNWLLADDALKRAWASAGGQAPQRRLRLRIDADAPELHAIPWELLRDASNGAAPQDLAAGLATPFSRYLAGKWLPGSPILKRPIKILVAIANPANLADYQLAGLDIAAEWALLEEATAGLEVELVQLPQPCTLSALEAALQEGVHLLHLIAHGIYDQGQNQAHLFLADQGNQVTLVSESDFAAMLTRRLADVEAQADNKLRLVFLASCQTATRSPADAFRGFAPALVQAGVPAVLAMQDFIPVDTAREFGRVFYRQLLQHGQVDRASNEARAALLTLKLSGAAIPVLFMRLRSGRLLGQRGQILGDRSDSFWSTLLDNIADGECTPFLGPGVTTDLLPDLPELAESLATTYNYPFPDRANLPKVAQFIGTIDEPRLRKDVLNTLTTAFQQRLGLESSRKDRRKSLTEIIEAANWSERSRDVLESEIHHQLADLELPLYLTTNFDNFMTLALQAKGVSPRRVTVPWREALSQEASRPHYDLEPPPSADEPVVLHLFGADDDLFSMVLTEDDYLDYLARITHDYQFLLPTSVNAALASTTLLFLGYRLEDLDLKVIMRGLLTKLDLARWRRLHVAVQIEGTMVDEAKQQEVLRYFQRYFANAKIDIYWGNTHQFVADLHARWQEYLDE